MLSLINVNDSMYVVVCVACLVALLLIRSPKTLSLCVAGDVL
jgi:hypothetical protein